MKKETLHIVHLGVSGFPYGFGAIQRLILMYKGLQEAGAEVLVINRKGQHLQSSGKELKKEGSYEGIKYVYTSPDPFRPTGFVSRTLQKIQGRIGEFKLLRKLKKEGKLDAASVYLIGEIDYLIYYWVLSRLFRFPLILSYVEYRSGIPSRTGLKTKITDYLYDRFSFYFADAILPISEYLIDEVKKFTPLKPLLKLPVISDFDKFDLSQKEETDPYFLYVGAASYKELIRFVLDAYAQVKLNNPVKLQLIMGGNESELAWVKKQLAEHLQKDMIELNANVPHTEIPKRMVNAAALLIPVRPTIQDAARFPHKVGEYVSSGNPLITTKFGEMGYYFKDEETALMADAYDPETFANRMEWVVNNLDEAKEIGRKSREMGLSEFGHKGHGIRLMKFIQTLRKQ